ncbi:MAG TPA: hypothetical protein V6D11_12235 [Waterburya sp.]
MLNFTRRAVLVVETFRRNVSTKFYGLPKKGIADPDLVSLVHPVNFRMLKNANWSGNEFLTCVIA